MTASPTLSSTTLNAFFKAQDYGSVIETVTKFLDQVDSAPFPATDSAASVGKFLNAAAFHLYYQAVAQTAHQASLAKCLTRAFETLSRAPTRPTELNEKCQSAGLNIILKRYLLDLDWPHLNLLGQAFLGFVQSTNAAPDLVVFLTHLLALSRSCHDLLATSPNWQPHLALALKDHRFGAGDYAWRSFFVLYTDLDIRCLAAKKGVPAVSDFLDRLQMTIVFVREKWPADPNQTIPCYERLVAQGTKMGACLVSQKRIAEAQSVFAASQRLFVDHMQPIGKYVPSIRIVALFNQILELAVSEKDTRQTLKVVQILQDILGRIQRGKATAITPFSASVCLALTHFYTFRCSYDQLVSVTSQEIQSNARLAAQTKPPENALSNDDPNDNCKDIGDNNPYVITLTAEREIELFSVLKKVLALLQEGFGLKERSLSGTGLSPNSVIRMIGCLGEFLDLLGYSPESETARGIFWEACQVFNNKDQEMCALKSLAQSQGELNPSQQDRVKALLQEPKTSAQLNLSLALAWDLLSRSRIKECFQICSSVLDLATSDCSGRLLVSESYWILTLCATKRRIPNPPNSLIHHGPHELGYEAYRNIMVTCASLEKQFGKYDSLLLDHMRSIRLKNEIIALRSHLFLWTGLAKELRLYGKIHLELVQSLALPTRFVSSLLNMVEIDLLCDDADQAELKLQGVGKIAQATIATSTPVGDVSHVKKKVPKSKAKDKLGASPNLKRALMVTPSWLDDDPSCTCLHCSQPLLLVIIVKYFNFKGVLHHMKEDLEAAASFFEGTVKLFELVEKKLDHILSPSVHFQVNIAIIQALQWQVECYCRDEYLSKCHDLLRIQRQKLEILPSVQRNRLDCLYENRFLEQSLMCRVPKDDLELSGLADKLSHLDVSSGSSQRGAGDFTTPVVTKASTNRRNPPRKPTKRLLMA
ncbi:hypothetical protein TCAL_01938 [Tigriopus californicus]|uniref:Uncharacterized protein n=1 Tax=Tigriopus californicus TaxID=6832 RepID=A0A553P6M1_TIGCA|nr:uncharacterized protein LOC131878363 [Tigriopus californicus]TRY73270.1 hypothetical protein TCAL_01938 [Tigriopus californicus]